MPNEVARSLSTKVLETPCHIILGYCLCFISLVGYYFCDSCVVVLATRGTGVARDSVSKCTTLLICVTSLTGV